MEPFDSIAPFYDLEHDGLLFDTTMYLELARRVTGDVLVLGCGTGRILAALAASESRSERRGSDAQSSSDRVFEPSFWGIDRSRAMLERAEDRLRGAGHVMLRTADIRTVRLEQRFGLVIVPLDTFTLMETQGDQIALLETGRTHMDDGGLVAIDMTNPLLLPEEDQGAMRRLRFQAQSEMGSVIAWDSAEIDWAAQTMRVCIDYELVHNSEASSVHVDLPVRWVYRYELEALMKLARLTILETWGDYDHSPYTSDSPRLIVLATGG